MSIFFEKENRKQQSTSYFYNLLNFSLERQSFLTDLEDSFHLVQVKDKRFKDLPSFYRASAVLVVSFLEQSMPELRQQTLNSIISQTLPLEDRQIHLKELFKLLRNLEDLRKNTIPHFQDIHNLFCFYGLIFMQMEKV